MIKCLKRWIGPLIWIVLLAVTGLAISFGAETEQRVSGSTVDLSKWDFENQGIYSMSGFWEFYPNRIILHEDFKAQYNLGVKQLIEVPRAFYDQQKFKDKYDSSYGTLRTIIKIPPHYIGHQMSIRSTLFYMNTAVFADGVELIKNQEVSRLGSVSDRLAPDLMASFTPKESEVEIIIHFTQKNSYGNAYGNIVFGTSGQIQNHVIQRLLVDTFLFSIMLILAIFNMGFFLRVNRRKSQERLALYFGLLVLVMGIRLINSGEHYLLYLIPTMPGELFSKLSYWSYYLLLPLFVLFACEVRKDMLPPVIRQISHYVVAFFGLFVLMVGHEIYVNLIPLYYIYFIVIVILLTVHITRSIQLKTDWLKAEFISFLIMALIFILDSLYILGYYEVRNYYLSTMLVFICYVTFMISKVYSSSVDQLENLVFRNDHLEAEKTQVEIQYANHLSEKQEIFEALIHQKDIRLSSLEKIAKEMNGALVILNSELRIISVYGTGADKHFGGDFEKDKFVKYFLGENSESGKLFTDILNKVAYLESPARIATYLSLLPKNAYKQGRWYEFETTVIQISKEEGQHFVIVINDITKFMQMKQKLAQTEKEVRLLKSYGKYENDIKYLISRVADFSQYELDGLIKKSENVDELIDSLTMVLERFAIWYETLGFDKTYMEFRKFILELDRLRKEAVPIQFEELAHIIKSSQLSEFDAEDRKMIRDYIGKELKINQEEYAHLENQYGDIIRMLEVILPYCEILADRYGKTLEPVKIEGLHVNVSLRKMGPIIRAISRVFDSIIVNNIEYYDERSKANKSLSGHINVLVTTTLTDLVIEIHDDGAGINVNTLKDSLYKLNLLSFKEIVNATDLEVMPYIFEPGVYYKESDNDYYGIGDGLWMVKEALTALKGTIEVESSYQSYCKFTVRVPLEEVC